MLKEGLIFGLLMPLLFKPREPMAAVNDDAAPLPELVMPSVASPEIETSATLPWPELPQMRTPGEAVAELLAELVEYHGAGATLRFSHITSYYRQFAGVRAWPAIADKPFSQLLCGLGCEREQRDLRSTEGRRITFITLVPSQAFDEDEIEAEPLRLAA